MSARSIAVVCACALITVSLTACGGDTRRALGLDRAAPDEFSVVSRAPLSLPPDYSLRPPEPGADRPQEGPVRDQARSVLLGPRSDAPATQAVEREGRTSGSVALLQRAGADRAPVDIRRIVNRETSQLIDEDRTFTDRLVFWRSDPPPGDVVDAEAESRRLRETQALGQPPTEGDTPIIRRRARGMLEGIF